MALPATDNFNRDNGALGANWTGSVGSDLAINANRVRGSTTGDCSMYWSADAPNAAQYAQIVYISANGWSGPFVRGSATDWVMLDAAFGDATKNYKIEWYHAGAYTVIGTAYNTTPATNDVIKITVSGTTFTGYINTTQRCQGSNAEAPATGYGGIYRYAQYDLDDFEVGNLSTSGSDAQPAYTKGKSTSTDSQPSYLKGQSTSTDSQTAYLYGNVTVVDSQLTYLRGYLEGQYLYPDSDISRSGSWLNETSGSVLYPSIDETSPSDSDYAKIDTTGSGAYFEVGLTNASGSPASSKDHVVRWRGAISSGSEAVSVRVELRQGSTTVAYRDQALTTSYRTYAFTLTSGEIAVITDYSDLRVRVTVL